MRNYIHDHKITPQKNLIKMQIKETIQKYGRSKLKFNIKPSTPEEFETAVHQC